MRLLSILIILSSPLSVIDAQAASVPSNQQLELRVEELIRRDPRVSAPGIEVDVPRDGTIELSGEVDSLLSSETAISLAKSVEGVRSVRSKMDVTPIESRSDKEIWQDIRSVLLSDPVTAPLITERRIAVAIENGSVQLSGTLVSTERYWRARNLIAQVRGVRSLENKMLIEPAPESRSERRMKTVLKRLNQKLALNALRGPQDHVTAMVQGNTIVLKGTVENIETHASIMRDALDSGAKGVTNEIRIRQPPENLIEQEYMAIDPQDLTSFGRFAYDPPWDYSPIDG